MASSAALLLAVRGFLEVLRLHLTSFQTGEVILLSTAKLRSAVAARLPRMQVEVAQLIYAT